MTVLDEAFLNSDGSLSEPPGAPHFFHGAEKVHFVVRRLADSLAMSRELVDAMADSELLLFQALIVMDASREFEMERAARRPAGLFIP